jgi:hypothetical protein
VAVHHTIDGGRSGADAPRGRPRLLSAFRVKAFDVRAGSCAAVVRAVAADPGDLNGCIAGHYRSSTSSHSVISTECIDSRVVLQRLVIDSRIKVGGGDFSLFRLRIRSKQTNHPLIVEPALNEFILSRSRRRGCVRASSPSIRTASMVHACSARGLPVGAIGIATILETPP